MGESEVLWAGTPILLPLPVTLPVPRGARGSDMGGMGLLDPLQAEGTGAGNAAMGWARWEQAPAKVNSATDIPRLHVLTDALVPGAWAKGVLSTPPKSSSSSHVCSCTCFSSGTVLGAARNLQHPLSSGAEAVAGPRLGLALLWARSQRLELGPWRCLGPSSPYCGDTVEHPHHLCREKLELLWELWQRRDSRVRLKC